MSNIPTEPVLIKICGNTNAADIALAEREGTDFLGVIVNHTPSPRNVPLHTATRLFAAAGAPLVAVTVNQTLAGLLTMAQALRPAALQLHGDEEPQLVRDLKSHGLTVWVACAGEGEAVKRRALQMIEAGADAVLLDARISSRDGVVYGGTGQRGDWRLARELVEAGARVILAGGLSPDNVAEAIETVRPWMVDTVSGVEAARGIKDEMKIRQFIESARGAMRD